MVKVQICVGSSCYLRGARELVDLFENEIATKHLEGKVDLSGAFCQEKCNRTGATVTVNGEVFTGVRPEDFAEFWKDKVAIHL